MNKDFSEQILADELSKITYSRSSIVNLSSWCIFHRDNAKQIIETWERQFHSCPKEKKIPFIYLANDILQRGRNYGPEFVDGFWKVIPAALKKVFKNDGVHGKHAISRLINIWVERRVFGSHAQDLKYFILGNQPPPAWEFNKDYSISSAGIVRRDSNTKSSVRGKGKKILSAFPTIICGKPKEDVHWNKYMNAVRRVGELEKGVEYACRQGDSQKGTLAKELHGQGNNLMKCVGKLISVESKRTTFVSRLKEVLKEQGSTMENVLTQIQLAKGMLLNKGTAAIDAEVVFELAASTHSPEIKTSIPSMFAAEEVKDACLVRSADSINSFSEDPAKKMKLQKLMPVSNPSAAATAFIHAQPTSVSAPHPPQNVLVQQAPIQNQNLAFQPQYNLNQSLTMQYLQPSEGVMTGPLHSYNAPSPPPPLPSSPPPPTPPPPASPPPPPPPLPLPLPPPPPQMMNLTMPVSWTYQLQQPVALVQQLPLPPPPPSMPMYQPLPINQLPINQPVSMNQQPAQFSIRKPMAPSYRTLLPPPMAFYRPHA